MADKYILIRTICTHYGLEQDFLDRLNETSLISYHIKDQDIYINKDQIGNLEKIIRLHYDLGINFEGIDVIFNLMERITEMEAELKLLKSHFLPLMTIFFDLPVT